ncbi:thymidylate kinase [Corynebacterium kutscheri]|nr:dTMP kinase [Corynebacterium kutscheri]AKE40707.1 thymidylate kinase [Corynebacterium kutscheri]VEH11104.1 thymidylate kinase [Corynebacterium kutscheri]VEH80418.1 thymidylate kinase [Corynebacterium kutscheri]
MIISIEGIDGAGKNTLVTALKERFDAHTIAFPRYRDSLPAQLGQAALYGKMGDLTDSIYGMATLFALDRHGIKEEIAAYSSGGEKTDKLLLLDRYSASNAAYSSARAENDELFAWVENLEFKTLGLPRPDLQLLLGTAPQLAQQRAQYREATDDTRVRDHYESDSGLQERTFAAYVRLAQLDWASPWWIIQPTQDVAQVASEIAHWAGKRLN